MLPIFDNYTWIAIMIVVMYYALKDLKDFLRSNIYLQLVNISGLIMGICVIDILGGGIFLDKIFHNYLHTLLPACIVVFLASLAAFSFHDIKNSELNETDKMREYRNKAKHISYIMIGFLMLHFRTSIGKAMFSIYKWVFFGK